MISEGERRVKILDYVRQNSANPKVTKSDVMRHMKEVSRAMTTHKTTIELIKEGKIKMVKPKDKPYSQIDYLVINEKNEFNKIYIYLAEIEDFMNRMKGPIDKLAKPLRKFRQKNDHDYAEEMAIREVHNCFLTPYREGLRVILHDILVRIGNLSYGEKDIEILYAKTIRLLTKMEASQWYWRVPDSNEIISIIISNTKDNLESAKYIQNYVKKYGVNLDITNDLITTIEKFKKEFLS